MKHLRAVVSAVVLASCTGETTNDDASNDGKNLQNSSPEDASADGGSSNASNGIECFLATVCVDGLVPEEWAAVCVSASTDLVSAAVYKVCVVDGRGVLGVLQLRGDQRVLNAGWTHSAYGNGNIASTLSPQDEVKCSASLTNFGDKPTTAFCPSAGP